MHAVQDDLPDPDRAPRGRRRKVSPACGCARSSRSSKQAAGRRSSSTTSPMPASSPARTAGWRRSCSTPRRWAGDAERSSAWWRRSTACTSARRGCRSSRWARDATLQTARSPAGARRCATSHSILYLYEDTVPFLARQIMRAADRLPREPAAAVLQGAGAARRALGLLVAHARATPAASASSSRRSATRCTQFFGENTLRSDLSISVPELGSLLDHTGPVKAAEAYAAQVFGADHTYFVTNGTSTANKIVWHSMAGRDDLVIVDRNCHKSLLHSLIMTGATPIYFTPARNDYGIIGPIGLDQFSPEAIQKKIAASPIARGAKGNVRIAVVTNSTYDGLCYNAEKIKADGGRPGRRAALRRGLVRLRRVPRVLRRPPRDGRAARPSARRPHAGVRHPLHAQAAGRVLAGLDDPHPGVREAQDRHDALQRRVHDARLDVAALRHHRLARRQLRDDGRRQRAARSCRRRTTRR